VRLVAHARAALSDLRSEPPPFPAYELVAERRSSQGGQSTTVHMKQYGASVRSHATPCHLRVGACPSPHCGRRSPASRHKALTPGTRRLPLGEALSASLDRYASLQMRTLRLRALLAPADLGPVQEVPLRPLPLADRPLSAQAGGQSLYPSPTPPQIAAGYNGLGSASATDRRSLRSRLAVGYRSRLFGHQRRPNSPCPIVLARRAILRAKPPTATGGFFVWGFPGRERAALLSHLSHYATFPRSAEVDDIPPSETMNSLQSCSVECG